MLPKRVIPCLDVATGRDVVSWIREAVQLGAAGTPTIAIVDYGVGIGWREVSFGRPENDYFYHAHQYAAQPASRQAVIGRTLLPYPGNPGYQIPGMVRHGNVYGTQFHPEKSGSAGLRLLRNFVEISGKNQAEL